MPAVLPDWVSLGREVNAAIRQEQPVVALESTVITHGLPYPENLKLAREMEREVREAGAIPATVGFIEGELTIGIPEESLVLLATAENVRKISARDLGAAIARGWSGGTTVAATMLAAQMAGIRVFATGGIGGVHRGGNFDISADLNQLSQTPVIVVCAGAKAILDLPATLEVLETYGVPVAGYQTDEFPAFYSRSSGLPVSVRVDSAEEAAQLAQAHWQMGLKSGVLIAQPPPDEEALPWEKVNEVIEKALRDCQREKISGPKVTPFLLKRVSELTGGTSLKTNLALLLNNARLAARIARCFTEA